jgi:hypothetical protein
MAWTKTYNILGIQESQALIPRYAHMGTFPPRPNCKERRLALKLFWQSFSNSDEVEVVFSPGIQL